VAPPGTPPPLQRRARIQALDITMPTTRNQQTLDLLDALLEQSRQHRDPSVAVFLLHSMARLHVSQLDNPAAALPLFDEALVLSRRQSIAPNLREMQLHYNRGFTLLRLGRYREAEAAFALTDQLAGVLHQQGLLGPRLASARGEIACAVGDRTHARRLLLGADADQQRSGDLRGRNSTRLRLAQLELDEGHLDEAGASAGEALEMARAGRFRSETRDALVLLEAVGMASGDRPQAYRYREQRAALDASLDRDAVLATLARMRARIDRDLGPGAGRAPELGQARLLRDAALAALTIVLAAGAALLWRLRRRRQHTIAGG